MNRFTFSVFQEHNNIKISYKKKLLLHNWFNVFYFDTSRNLENKKITVFTTISLTYCECKLLILNFLIYNYLYLKINTYTA